MLARGPYGLASTYMHMSLPAHSNVLPGTLPDTPLRLSSPAPLPHAKDPTDDPPNVGGTNNISIPWFSSMGNVMHGEGGGRSRGHREHPYFPDPS